MEKEKGVRSLELTNSMVERDRRKRGQIFAIDILDGGGSRKGVRSLELTN